MCNNTDVYYDNNPETHNVSLKHVVQPAAWGSRPLKLICINKHVWGLGIIIMRFV